MDMSIVIAVMILIFIVVLEFVSLFRSRSCNDNILDFVAVVPVFSQDDNLSERLCCLSEKTACGQCHAEQIILIDYGASPQQLEICRRFCLDNPCAVIVNSEDTGKIFSEMFAIDMKR
ncbi:MAG: hypothetical protein K2K02_07965 [Ruminococcus sp.]|nr:hypothetical protein [Ruminococcus sp.]MDE6501402.1 hypothetical protein [Ruminococcus sp.]MDE6678963.1 hypothetical protein [Ruminococcus sp.]